MSSFTEPLTVQKLKGGYWKVARNFRYYIGKENSNKYVEVKKDFRTDFASVPRPFWVLLPPDGQYTQAAVTHDFLYSERFIWIDKGGGATVKIFINRKEADDIFDEAMTVLNVPFIKRRVMYRAVRFFGWIPWTQKS